MESEKVVFSAEGTPQGDKNNLLFVKTVEKALNSSFNDLEDAIQYYTAAENNINVILTRNLRDYKSANIVVQTLEEYLITHGWC